MYNNIFRNHSKKADGGDPNSNAYVLHASPAMSWVTDPGMAFYAKRARLENRSGGAAHVGYGVRRAKHLWLAGQWTHAGTVFTEDTVDAQDAGANDFALETLTANDGFVVLCRERFNCLVLNVGTASVGGAPVRDLSYSLGGNFNTAIGNVLVPPFAGLWPTGEQLIWFVPPDDWALTTGAEGTNIPPGYYAVRVRSTTAPSTTAGLASTMSVLWVPLFERDVPDTVSADLVTGSDRDELVGIGDALVSVFSVANAANEVQSQSRVKDI